MAKKGDGKKRSDVRKSDARLAVRVTSEGLARFFERALDAGFDSAQAYLRAFISGEVGFELSTRKAIIRSLGQLTGAARNLNQLTTLAHMGRIQNFGPKHVQHIKDIRAATTGLAREIRELLS